MSWDVLIRPAIFSLTVIMSLSGTVFGENLGHEDRSSFVLRSIGQYEVPAVTLLDQENQRIQLEQVLDQDQPILVEFFFTTCTTFCDVRAARLLAVQQALAQDDIEMHFLSISTDPEYDTPSRLRSYATRFRPVPQNWSLLTGAVRDIRRVEQSFDAHNPSADKMLHQPLTFIRPRPGADWVRLEGMMSNEVLAEHVRLVLSESSPPISRMSGSSSHRDDDGT